MELVKPDGRVISGMPCIYHLGGGLTFFCEGVREDGDSFIFEPDKTVWIVVSPPRPDGNQEISAMKGFGPLVPFRPSSIRVGKGGIMVTDCTDPSMLKLFRSTLAGIVLASPGDLPPGGKVH